KHEMGTCLILSVLTNYRLKNQLVNKSNQLISMITKSSYLQSTEISTDINLTPVQASLHYLTS
ncbi:hypothetical protein, partial [Thiolapillus sp.]|uniref:hypothetical protein n=1 Tax=Thiolapillus sp. TaxID=2017437 RepID=UPI0025FB61B6